MIGYRLNTKQKDELVGQQFATDSYFNPVKDINGVYFIFEGEVDNCTNNEFMWVKELPTGDYVPALNNEAP